MTVFLPEPLLKNKSRLSPFRQRMNVLIVGSGGREHALLWKLKQSPHISNIYVAPGNAGTASLGKNIPINADDIEGLVAFAKREKIGLTIVGPEKPLSLGIVDAFKKQKLAIFGPSSMAAEIETDKAFAKLLMRERNVPTADFRVFNKYEAALQYVETIPPVCVIKATGLAGGKGVILCNTRDEAKEAVHNLMKERVHGHAGNSVVIEAFLRGDEVSLHAITDGKAYVLFPQSQDHKRVGDGDTGSNTGGMGVIAPFPHMPPLKLNDLSKKVVDPILSGLRAKGRTFSGGCLYPGLMLTPEGPNVLEYNARFGDPETQVYMRLLKSDLFPLLYGAARGTLEGVEVAWHPGFAICVVLAGGGYPDIKEPAKGHLIRGLKDAEMIADVEIFHMSTRVSGNGVRDNGGRILGVTATGSSIESARRKAYQAVDLIQFEGKHFRTDIGLRKVVSF